MTATNLADAQKQGPILAWGSFAPFAGDLMIVAAALFLIVKSLDRVKRRTAFEPPRTVAPSRQDVLMTEIRDLLARDKV